VPSILELLQKAQLIDDRAHDAVMSRTKSRSGGHIVQQVAELGLATEPSIARAISVELGLPRIDLQMTPPEAAALNLLDARTCADRFVLPIALRENGELLWLAMADPTDQDSIAVVRHRTQKRVRPAVAGPSEILRAVRQCYGAPGAGAEQQPEEPPADKAGRHRAGRHRDGRGGAGRLAGRVRLAAGQDRLRAGRRRARRPALQARAASGTGRGGR